MLLLYLLFNQFFVVVSIHKVYASSMFVNITFCVGILFSMLLIKFFIHFARLDESTSNKVTFVNSEEELCKYLIPDILPDDI